MLDEELLGGRRGGVGGGGAHELAGGEGHGEGAEQAAETGQAEPGGARAALRPGGRLPVTRRRERCVGSFTFAASDPLKAKQQGQGQHCRDARKPPAGAGPAAEAALMPPLGRRGHRAALSAHLPTAGAHTHRITESTRLERPPRPSSPIHDQTSPRQLDHVTKWHIQPFVKHLQGRCLHHLPGELIPMTNPPLCEQSST